MNIFNSFFRFLQNKLVFINTPKKAYAFLGIILLITISIPLSFYLASLRQHSLEPNNDNQQTRVSPTPQPNIQEPVTAVITTYPKTYKGETVSQNIYDQIKATYGDTENEQVKLYGIDLITRYYIYKDILEENNIKTTLSATTSNLQTITTDIDQMENLIKEQLVTTMDYGYIKIRYISPSADIAKKRFPDLKIKAMELIETYRNKLAANPQNIQQIIQESNSDPDVLLLNHNEKNEYIENYTADDSLFIPKEPFHDFLFNLKQDEVSATHTLVDDVGEYAYLIVYPTNVTKKPVQSLNAAIKEKLQNFQ